MINRLRALFPLSKKRYIITGAPQCIVPDANMGRMITGAKFDILYIQYYNTPQCSARSWWNANPNYPRTRRENVSGFRTSYQQWVTFLATTASKDAKLHIGLPGSPKATFDPSFYVPSSIVSNLLRAYFCKPKFGGVMVWEATYADEARVGGTSVTFYQHVKKVLIALSRDKSTACYGKWCWNMKCFDDRAVPIVSWKCNILSIRFRCNYRCRTLHEGWNLTGAEEIAYQHQSERSDPSR